VEEERLSRMRVFMLSNHPLFIRGVESMLSQEAGLEIVGLACNVDGALQRIEELRPDVIIVDSTGPDCDPHLVVSQVLREGAKTRVIGLNLHDNIMFIYYGEHKAACGVEDLVQAVCG
jgi:DNA-binding NarL/FixJ family response regulator